MASESSISKVVSARTRFRICLKKRRTEQVNSVVDDDRVRAAKKIRKRRWAAEEEVVLVDNVPEEIRDNILMRLPVDSLLRCTAVCKPWKDVIQSSEFIRTHLNRGKTKTTKSGDDDDDDEDENGLLLLRSSQDPCGTRFDYSLHLYDSPSFSEYSKLANPFEAYKTKIANNPPSSISSQLVEQAIRRGLDDCWVRVVGTYNGLLCLHHSTTSTTMIANPCIRKFVILPPPIVPRPDNYNYSYHQCFAFGYDSRTNDYKVFRSVADGMGHTASCQIEIWSLAKGYWKSLSADVIPANFSPDVFTSHGQQQPFLKGAVHWIHYPPLADRLPNFIVSFNMSTELFGKIAIPEAALKWHKNRYVYKPKSQIYDDAFTISTYAQSLAVFEKHEESESNGIFFISMWRMKEYGVAESWQKLFTVRLQGEVPYRLRALRKSREVVLWYYEEQCRSVDIKTLELNGFQIAGYHCVCFNLDYFVESLVLLDHPSAISY